MLTQRGSRGRKLSILVKKTEVMNRKQYDINDTEWPNYQSPFPVDVQNSSRETYPYPLPSSRKPEGFPLGQ